MMYHRTNRDATMQNNNMSITDWYTEKIICFSVQRAKKYEVTVCIRYGTST